MNIAIERVDPLRVQVANQLRNQLRLGQFQPGKRLTEKGIASTLGVSRTPAREALSMLGENGVLEILPNGGYAVPKITHEDITDIYEVRKLLEVPALKKSVKLADQSLIDELSRLLNTLVDSLKDFKSVSYFVGVVNFRETLFGGCKNEYLTRNILKVDNYTECLKSLALSDATVRRELNIFYQRILQAVIDGNAKEAARALAEHHEQGIAAYHAVLDEL